MVPMGLGLIGRKIGMTSIYNEDGRLIPVTVVEAIPNRITQIKTNEVDGYTSLQLTGGYKKVKSVSKPLKGHFAKAGSEPGNLIREFPVEALDQYELGQQLTVTEVFEEGQYLDITGTSKGKGFAGGVKKWNFATQDATHGNSKSHRAPGSIGQNQSPGRVFKGKKMAGQLGNKKSTVQSCQLIKIDAEKNLLLINGSIPGAPGSKVIVKPAVKKQKRS